MSESPDPTPSAPPPAGGGARYPRTPGGLVGAMLVTVVAVIAFAAFRSLTSDNDSTPVRSVDYSTSVKTARAEGQLLVAAPMRLPIGWKATSVTYARGASPTWHLGILTATKQYVGVEEARTSVRSLVKEHVDTAAERGEDVLIAGKKWQMWTDTGGDYAVARSLRSGDRPQEALLVVGSAPAPKIREIAANLDYGAESD